MWELAIVWSENVVDSFKRDGNFIWSMNIQQYFNGVVLEWTKLLNEDRNYIWQKRGQKVGPKLDFKLFSLLIFRLVDNKWDNHYLNKSMIWKTLGAWFFISKHRYPISYERYHWGPPFIGETASKNLINGPIFVSAIPYH